MIHAKEQSKLIGRPKVIDDPEVIENFQTIETRYSVSGFGAELELGMGLDAVF